MKCNFWLLVILLFGLFSCDVAESRYSMGDDFLNDPTRVVMIDTMTVRTYTIRTDSFVTSNTPRLLVGTMVDQFTNSKTYCESYFRIDSAYRQTLNNSAVFDSASLILHFDGYQIGDTAAVNTIAAYRLTEDIRFDKDSEWIFNKKFSSEQNPLGTASYILDNKKDSISIPLIRSVGDSLFSYVDNDYKNWSYMSYKYDQYGNINDSIRIYYPFQSYFKGIAIKPLGAITGSIVGFVSKIDSLRSPYIAVYYHDHTENDNLILRFPLSSKSYLSSLTGQVASGSAYITNYVLNEYNGSKMGLVNSINSEEKLLSEQTDNSTFLRGGDILRTRIEIPFIDNLYDLGRGSVVRAQLIFKPLVNSFSKKSDLPSTLEMYLVDKKNKIISSSPLTGVDNKTSVYAQLYYDPIFKSETFYSFDLTRFFKDEYDTKVIKDYALMLSIPRNEENFILNRLIIGDQNNIDSQLKLKVYLTIN